MHPSARIVACAFLSLCLAGTVNQIDRPGTVFRLMAQAAMA